MKKAPVKRIVGWIAAALVVVVLIAVALAPHPVEVDVAAVTRGAMQVTLDQEGKTRVRERYVVSAPVAGQILRIELEPGDPVRAGATPLVTLLPIDPSPLDARSRAEAEGRVRAAEGSLERATAERQRAAAQDDLARTELARTRKLLGVGVATQEALDNAAAAAAASREALAASEAAVRAAAGELAAARAAVEVAASAAEPRGDDGRALVVRSPVDGVVLRRMRESRAVVGAGEPLIEVGDPGNLEVVADYLSRDAVKIAAGMPVRIDQWGGDTTLNGSVTRVEPSGFMKVSALGVEEQRVNVIVAFDDPAAAWKALGDAYRVETRTVVWQQDDVVHVPASALFRHGDGWAVFRLDGDRARLVPVQVGRRNGLQAQVLSGLEPGDEVVSHPSDDVGDGVRVRRRAG